METIMIIFCCAVGILLTGILVMLVEIREDMKWRWGRFVDIINENFYDVEVKLSLIDRHIDRHLSCIRSQYGVLDEKTGKAPPLYKPKKKHKLK